MSEYTTIEIQYDGHVAVVEMFGTGRGNAMGPAFWEELPRAFSELDRDDQVRVVVIRGRGEHFTYGLDLKAVAPMFAGILGGNNLAKERVQLQETIARWQSTFSAVAACRKPVIAAIDGWCIGGGVNLISACDVRICTQNAKFSLREPRVAIVPDVGALQRLPQLIGEGATRMMAFTAGDFDAKWAYEHGLVEEICGDADGLMQRASQLAAQIAANSPLAVQGAKQVLEFSKDATTAAGLQYVAAWNSAFLQSRDLMEAFTAFAEGRDPVYGGE